MMRSAATRASTGARRAAPCVALGAVAAAALKLAAVGVVSIALSGCPLGTVPAAPGNTVERTAATAAGASGGAAAEPTRRIGLGELRSGSAFTSPEVRTQELDEFANPGMLWVERGTRLFREPAGSAKQACSGCHDAARMPMRGVAARYPAIDAKSGKLFNLADRIVECRVTHQLAARPEWESEELLALTAYVMRESRGLPITANVTGPARRHFEAGRVLYEQRSGQMNLACMHCHDQLWGKTLFNERISQGHANAFPIYRLNWQSAGSIERRLRACYSGIRAEMMPYGAPEHRELELYLAWRAQGLPIETPGVRR